MGDTVCVPHPNTDTPAETACELNCRAAAAQVSDGLVAPNGLPACALLGEPKHSHRFFGAVPQNGSTNAQGFFTVRATQKNELVGYYNHELESACEPMIDSF